MNNYYFTFSLKIYEDVDISQIEKTLGVKATKLTSYNDSVGPTKSAKLYIRTKEYSQTYTDEKFAQFIDLFSAKKNIINEIQKQYKTDLVICIVFTTLKEKPCISLSKETIKLLSELNANYDIDFI